MRFDFVISQARPIDGERVSIMRGTNFTDHQFDRLLTRRAERDSWRHPFDFDTPEPSSDEVDRLAFHRTAQVLVEIGRALTNYSSHSAAVAFALGLHEADGGCLSEIGERLGMSKQAINSKVAGLRSIFGASLPYRDNTVPLIRPSNPGRWITRAELYREFMMEAAKADRLGCRSETPTGNRQHQRFWDADHLHQLLDAKAVAEAIARARSIDGRAQSETGTRPTENLSETETNPKLIK
jgi:hypothetical protein